MLRIIVLALVLTNVSTVPDERDLLAGPISDAQLGELLHQQSPTILAPALEHQLVTLAGSALLADLTGHGREHFPDYLPGPRPLRGHTAVRIQTGVARQVSGSGVEVLLVWAGTDPAGDQLERQHTTVRLDYGPYGWRPVAP
ncbi:hypothetical protein [Amycolatopsis magusensis]|uniref:hypothetical protein n=1 Tax=Amycolatopsis magusensis TaxID=882444 RepID=UPI0024A7B747|nr:hypothetical protein [Amycolatopsis magusensis]MDI5975488.1 hypothetical protein [Amycolatopsis magusensis]